MSLKEVTVNDKVTYGYQFFKDKKITKFIIDRSGDPITDKTLTKIHKNVSNHYYNEEGNLQWNIYYIIITDISKINSDLISSIVDNTEYAKKLLLTEGQLDAITYNLNKHNKLTLLEESDFLEKIKNVFDASMINAWANANEFKTVNRTKLADQLFKLFNLDKKLETRQSFFEYSLYSYISTAIENNEDIIIENFGCFASDIDVLRILDTLRYCLSTYDFNLKIYTPNSKYRSLIKKKFHLFMEEE